MMKMRERIICCGIAIIMFFLGMCLDTIETHSSFLCATIGHEHAAFSSVDYLTEGADSCTSEMIGKGNSLSTIRGDFGRTSIRWDKTIVLSIVVGAILQYLLYLRSTIAGDCFEILHSDTVAVHYIHCKDGEK